MTWESADESIVTVDKNGKVKGVGEGKTTVTATTANNKTAKCTVRVVKKATALKSLDKFTAAELEAGKTLQVKPVINPAKATGVIFRYESSKPNIAAIDAAGVITALKPGKTTITVTAGKLTRKFTLTVK